MDLSKKAQLEIWKNIPGYLGKYQVSNHGRVKSLARHRVGKAFSPTFMPERILKHDIHKKDRHHRVTLCKHGKTKRFQVHTLVLEAFYNGYNKSLKADHTDRNPNNNHISNLRMCTLSQNQWNCGPQKDKKYKCINFEGNRFRVRFRCNGEAISVGRYKTIEEAVEAYNKEIVKHHGKFAYLNEV